MKSIVEQIHEKFNTSQDKLLLQKPNSSAECLYNLGFYKSSSTQDFFISSPEIQRYAEYYRRNYPNHRFISEKQVEIICKKYGLLCAGVGQYTGEVPMSKIAAIDSFRVRKGDIAIRWIHETFVESVPWLDEDGNTRGFSFRDPSETKPHDRSEMVKAMGLWICAPESLLDMEGATRVGHNVDINDPVVLQPVEGGFLIVAAWGDEASDENVINHTMN